MATNTLDFNTLAPANPATPPAGWTAGGDPSLIFFTGGLNQLNRASGNQSTWYDNTNLTSDVIGGEVVIGTTNGSANGPSLLNNSTGNGFIALTSDGTGNTRFFLMSNFQLGSQVGSAITQSHVAGQARGIYLTKSTNQLVFTVNGVQIGSTIDVTAYSSYNVNRFGATSRGGYLRSMTSEYTPAQTLDTLTDPLVAGAAFSGTSTGFSDGAATLSSNGLSAAVTIASGAFSGTWPIAVDAQPYPTLPKLAQTITLTQGANTATITSDLEPPAGTEVVNLVSPITGDDTYPGYYFEQDGFTAEGAQFVFTPYSDLTMAADGEILVTGEGNLIGYLIPATGTGAGNAYYYTFQISDGGDVITGNRGITAVGLTMSGITMRGITAVGL